MSALQIAIAALLGLGVLLSAIPRVRAAKAGASEAMPSLGAAARGSSIAVRLVLAALGAVLLYLALFPPSRPAPVPRPLTVLAADWRGAAASAPVDEGATLITLPEAEDPPTAAERVPDLATALRRHPQADGLRVFGRYLSARDRDAAAGRLTDFVSAPPPEGLHALDWTRRPQRGESVRVNGQVSGAGIAAVELRDPAGEALQRAAPDADGRFALSTPTRAPGPVLLSLRLLDADGGARGGIPLPIEVRTPAPLRVLLLAGAPSPELKLLRRWIEDAGLELDARIAFGRGVVLGGPGLAPDGETLARSDLVILDERAWDALGPGGRAALLAAAREGLGVLLRLTQRPGPAGREDLLALGWRIEAGDGARELALAGVEAPRLHRAALRVEHAEAVPLLRAQDGSAVAAWRPFGQGRIGVWWLLDSFRLALAGEAEAHAALWRRASETLARARRDVAEAAAPDWIWRDERAVECGLEASASAARVRDPAGAAIELLPDARGCAAWWPRDPGLHAIETGDARRWRYVHAAEHAPALYAAQQEVATRRLLAQPLPEPRARAAPTPAPGWHWALGWLGVALLLWWLERRGRAG